MMLSHFFKNTDDGKHLFVHIGPRKTGTTAIQRALVQNDDLLARNGFCCVLAAGARNVDMARDPKKIAQAVHSARHDKVVLSYEGYLSDRRRELLNAVYGQFDPQRLTFIMYARRPDLRMESWCNYNMNRDSGRIDSRPEDFLSEKAVDIEALRRGEAIDDNFCLMDYPGLCREIRERFPGCGIEVRPYWEKNMRGGWDIFQDFCHTLGITEYPPRSADANPTLSRTANRILEVMRKRADKVHCRFKNHVMYDMLRSHAVFRATSANGADTHPLFSPEERARVLGIYREPLRELLREQGMSDAEFEQWIEIVAPQSATEPAMDETHVALAEACIDYINDSGRRPGLAERLAKKFGL